ncbi:MAG: polyhydroxyalkanoate synthesis regulator DNA-binding domain-containing protein [Syntrophobacteraceae bacterium]|nr:polyhydroxyalkanoate synthesis regulator DNA-binding domain-containing protein [Syntrophobacteraceae bacterium]
MSEKIVLKKYANRRLYDPERSAFITLDQVSRLIRNGRQVSVIDARTSEDVTAFILTQIIVEEAKNKNVLLPVSFLHLVIQYREEVLAEFFENYLDLTIKNYLLYKSAFDDHFRKWLDVGRDLSSIGRKSLPAPALFDLFFNAGKKVEEEEPLS